MLQFYPRRRASPPAVEEESTGTQCYPQGTFCGQNAIRNQSTRHGGMTLALSVRFPPTDIKVDTRTRARGSVQLLLEYGPDTHRLPDAWEHWTSSYLRGHFHRPLHIQMSDKTCHPRVAKVGTR